MARANGLRAVSVEDAICYVPRTATLNAEFQRKIRTMARGLETLWQWRRMLNPARHGLFAFMLVSHKLCRWLIYLFAPLVFVGLTLLAPSFRLGGVLLAVATVGLLSAIAAWRRLQKAGRVNRVVALLGYSFASTCAGFLAWVKVLRRQQSAIWEPTRRPA
jgi:hypothetical protein